MNVVEVLSRALEEALLSSVMKVYACLTDVEFMSLAWRTKLREGGSDVTELENLCISL